MLSNKTIGIIMPAPVTHIVLSFLVLPFLPTKDKRDFILGASFPDIRYYRVIDRATSHKKDPSWKSITEERSSFKAGMEFHALVDEMHDEYMRTHEVMRLLPGSWRSSPHYLKFFEDMMLYQYVSNWPEIAEYFDTILKEELVLVSDPRAVTLWHQTIKKYILSPPTPDAVYAMLNVKLPKWYNFIVRMPIKINATTIATTLATNLGSAQVNWPLLDAISYFYNNYLLYLYPQEALTTLSDKILLHGQ